MSEQSNYLWPAFGFCDLGQRRRKFPPNREFPLTPFSDDAKMQSR
jgi:hypothetical protein